MKKVLLTAMTILSVASTSVFGMYGFTDSWMDFLVHGNQMRARMEQLGVTLGNGTIKGTFGVKANTGAIGSIISSGKIPGENQPKERLDATISAGIGYTSSIFGIGVGYNYTFIDNYLSMHTPVLAMNFLDNNLRFVAPIQVAVSDKYQGVTDQKYTGVAFDGIQLRYYTGIDAFSAIRLYVHYRNTSTEMKGIDNSKQVSEALGVQARLYFLNSTVGNVALSPFVRIEYHTALKGNTVKNYIAFYGSVADEKAEFLSANKSQSDIYEANAFEFSFKPTLGLTANSDVVSLYVEPSLGYKVKGDAPHKGTKQTITHALTWGAYSELYVTPVKDLEFYFEMDVNGDVDGVNNKANSSLSPVYFETSTGITWYLPSFQE